MPATLPWRSLIFSAHVVGSAGVKVAVTFLDAFISTLQAPFPVQAPDHAWNLAPTPGFGVRPTMVPVFYCPPRSVGGSPMAPPPPGDNVSVTGAGGGGASVKVAVTLLAAFIVTPQAPVPVQAPDQPLN